MQPDTNGKSGRILEVRKALGFSQKDFADSIKISNTYLSAMELNQRTVNDRILKIISLTYGVREEWLTTGNGEMFNQITQSRLQKLIDNFNKLDTLKQDCVLEQLDVILKYHEKEKNVD